MSAGYDETLLAIFRAFGWENGSCRFIVEDRESLWTWIERWRAGKVEPCARCAKPLDVDDVDTIFDEEHGDSVYHQDCWEQLDQDVEDAYWDRRTMEARGE